MQLLMPQEQIDRDPQAWLALRRSDQHTGWKLGASELSQVMGFAPKAWGGAYSLYWAKLEGTSKPDSDDMRRGRHLEPYISERFAAENPSVTLQPGGLYASTTVQWLRATFDKLGTDATSVTVPGEPGCVFPVQYKSAVPQRDEDGQPEWGEDGTDRIPLHIAVQVQAEMIVSEADHALVPCLDMLRWRVRVYRVEADREDQAAIVAAGDEMVARLEHRRPPAVDWTPEATRTLWARHPDVEDRAVRVPVELWRRWDHARAAEAAAKQRKQLAANQLLERMGTAERAYLVHPATGADVIVARRRISPRKGYMVQPNPRVESLNPASRPAGL